ncbi:hypothetical protein IM774_09650 [Erysipelotrichaceae bacterium RD49]|nr:hypothetical protein [Erysipelotrichaceae bacterium RD49]
MIVTFYILASGLRHLVQITNPAKMSLNHLAELCQTKWNLNGTPVFFSLAVGNFLDENTPLSKLDLAEGDTVVIAPIQAELI